MLNQPQETPNSTKNGMFKSQLNVP